MLSTRSAYAHDRPSTGAVGQQITLLQMLRAGSSAQVFTQHTTVCTHDCCGDNGCCSGLLPQHRAASACTHMLTSRQQGLAAIAIVVHARQDVHACPPAFHSHLLLSCDVCLVLSCPVLHPHARMHMRPMQKNLAAGAMGLSVAFDLPTHRGYDSDHLRVQGGGRFTASQPKPLQHAFRNVHQIKTDLPDSLLGWLMHKDIQFGCS